MWAASSDCCGFFQGKEPIAGRDFLPQQMQVAGALRRRHALCKGVCTFVCLGFFYQKCQHAIKVLRELKGVFSSGQRWRRIRPGSYSHRHLGVWRLQQNRPLLLVRVLVYWIMAIRLWSCKEQIWFHPVEFCKILRARWQHSKHQHHNSNYMIIVHNELFVSRFCQNPGSYGSNQTFIQCQQSCLNWNSMKL